ncbi:MAG: hypothetical protein ABR975_06510, partial [Vulcanimicrobiaceae bacterium]
LRFARLGAPALTALALAACSGGGGGGTTVPHSVPQTSPSTTPSSPPVTTGSQARLTVTIPRIKTSSYGKTTAATKRSPRYISTYAEGLQVAATAGTTTKTLYFDISSNNTSCTFTPTAETCTLTLPWLAASETISATETDATPTNENQTTFQGDGFPTSTDILAIGTTQATLTPGVATTVSLGLSPIAYSFFDGTNAVDQAFSGQFPGLLTLALDSPTFAVDPQVFTDTTQRVVVTAGTQVQGLVATTFEDFDGGDYDDDTTPLPFANLADAAAPFTVTASGSGTTVFPYANTGFSNAFSALPQAGATAPPSAPSGYTQNATIPNDGYQWANSFFLTGIYYDGTSSAGSTVTFSTASSAATATATLVANSSTAPTPFTVGPYTASFQYTIVPVSASASATSTSLGGASITVTGSSAGAEYPMSFDSDCTGTGGASITSGSSENTFVVSPVAAGTCTLYLNDGDTDVASNPITLTIGGYTTPSGFTASPSNVAFDLASNTAPVTVTLTDNAGSLSSASPTIACVPTGDSNTVASVGGYASSSPSSATFNVLVPAGAGTGVCTVTITDGSGNKLGLPVTVTENEIGVFAKHRNRKTK